MMELYNAQKFITMLFFIQKILTFNLGVAFLKSVSIYVYHAKFVCTKFRHITINTYSAHVNGYTFNINHSSISLPQYLNTV